MVKEITKFIAEDGTEFANIVDAEMHEEVVRKRQKNRYDDFLKTYSFSRLNETYHLDDYGIWEVRGEDPNPDFGGHHHEPFIANVEGILDDVIRWAVAQDKFWTWGGGGSIQPAIKHNVIKV